MVATELIDHLREVASDIEVIASKVQDAADDIEDASEADDCPECDITPEEFAARMRAASVYGADIARADAYRLMCGVLRELGYGEGVRVFENLIA